MEKIDEILKKQRKFFNTGKTKNIKYRLEHLKKLKKSILENEEEIKKALKLDLNKSESESYMTEIGMTLSELSYDIRHVKSWCKNKRVGTPLAHFPSRSFILKEPYGVTLILSPWNYPFMLLIEPLIGAICAGNCAVLKPSEFAPNTANVIEKIIKECFEEDYVTVIQGDKDVSQALIEKNFDYIFYTGGTKVGKIVMQEASKNLVPFTLELGGKSPCIIDEKYSMHLAAKRLLFGKLLNAGQTCIAPDYVLVNENVKEELIEELKRVLKEFLGENVIENEDYPKIVNERHFARLSNLIEGEKILIGGKTDKKLLKIEPTILDNPKIDSKVMSEEIFGPILPIISYKTIEDAIAYVKKFEKPLALYMFTNDKKIQNRIMNEISFGGGCINDTIIHIANSNMGFGGVGYSGIGNYHGKRSFDTFSHERSITKKYGLDLPMRYMPYNDFKDKLIRMFLK